MPIKPPTCRTCGVAEWRHVCTMAPRAALDAAKKRKAEVKKEEPKGKRK